MLDNRKDTPKRVAQYVERGCATVYLEDARLPRTERLRLAVLQGFAQEALRFEKRLLGLQVFCDAEVDEEHGSSYLARSNTSHSSTNSPRMAELTSHGIELFFRKL